MASICYSWDDNPFMWLETPFTWREGCVIEKLISKVNLPLKTKIKKLTEEERQIIIGLFIRLEVDEIVFENRVNKHKNNKVKLKLKDFEINPSIQKNIMVNVKIN